MIKYRQEVLKGRERELFARRNLPGVEEVSLRIGIQ